jgi:hypothetical protein
MGDGLPNLDGQPTEGLNGDTQGAELDGAGTGSPSPWAGTSTGLASIDMETISRWDFVRS